MDIKNYKEFITLNEKNELDPQKEVNDIIDTMNKHKTSVSSDYTFDEFLFLAPFFKKHFKEFNADVRENGKVVIVTPLIRNKKNI